MIFNLDERHSLKATVLESGKKCINWVSVGTFETLSRNVGAPLATVETTTALKFSTDKDYISKLYLAQFETHQNYHFQIIGQNMCKV